MNCARRAHRHDCGAALAALTLSALLAGSARASEQPLWEFGIGIGAVALALMSNST